MTEVALCPRCDGKLRDERDWYGEYRYCFCGYHAYPVSTGAPIDPAVEVAAQGRGRGRTDVPGRAQIDLAMVVAHLLKRSGSLHFRTITEALLKQGLLPDLKAPSQAVHYLLSSRQEFKRKGRNRAERGFWELSSLGEKLAGGNYAEGIEVRE